MSNRSVARIAPTPKPRRPLTVADYAALTALDAKVAKLKKEAKRLRVRFARAGQEAAR